jgi:hypothetical protein
VEVIRATAPGYTFEVTYIEETGAAACAEACRFRDWLAHIEKQLGPGAEVVVEEEPPAETMEGETK